jgi:PAS domain S-box-containing protein
MSYHDPDLIGGKSTDEELDCAAKLSLEMIGTAGFDGYFKQLNAAAEKILGYSRDELLAKPFIEFVHADDRTATESAAGLLADGTGVANFVNRYRCKDGSYRWLQWQARSSMPDKLIYFAGRDVTEQKEVAESFRRQEEQYRLLFETNPSPMWVYDTETLKFLAVNEAAIRRYGYSREEFPKHNKRSRCAPTSRRRVATSNQGRQPAPGRDLFESDSLRGQTSAYGHGHRYYRTQAR